MKTVLIVDNNQLILDLIENKINPISNIKVLKALTYKEAVKHINEEDIIHIAILDLNLPDAKNGEVVDYTISKDIPSMILTDSMSDNLQRIILQEDIIDYAIKTDLNSMDYTVNIINRTLNNYDRSILVVDDSKFQLSIVSKMLKKMKINVITALDGQEAFDIIKNTDEQRQFSLILTDFSMPKMDGLELTLKLRSLYQKDELSIIVMSANDEPEVSTKFIKIGANDFIGKPFTQTEFITRVNSNLDLINLFEKTKELANKDYLTCLYNRRFFFASGESIVNKSKRKNLDIAVAVLNIDNIQDINDKYGYNIGDKVIQDTAEIINKNLRSSDLISRFKDDEFAILLEDISLENTRAIFIKIEQALKEHTVNISELGLVFHSRIGIYYGKDDDSLNSMIKKAKQSLENSKMYENELIKINDY